MAKNELKTKVNEASVTDFINSVPDEQTRKDCFEILKMMKQATKVRTEDVGGEHCRFWELSLQRRQRARRRLDADRLLPAQTKPDAVFDGRF